MKPNKPNYGLYKRKGTRLTRKTEEDNQMDISLYLQRKYPEVLFISDLAGTNLASHSARRVYKLRSQTRDDNGNIIAVSFPDVMILETAKTPEGYPLYSGLCIELKKSGTKVLKKDNTIRASQNNHLGRQADCLHKLRLKGYMSCFCVGSQAAIKLIDLYMTDPYTIAYYENNQEAMLKAGIQKLKDSFVYVFGQE